MRIVRASRTKQARRAATDTTRVGAHRSPQSAHWPEARCIELDGVSHSYGHAAGSAGRPSAEPNGEPSRGGFSVRNLSLRVGSGESIALLGPSGCGKTTLLRLISGLEQPIAGVITLGDRIVADAAQRQRVWVPAEQRGVGMVFQDWALFPHLDVGRNVGYGLPRAERTPKRIAEALDLVGLVGFEQRLPSTLSGGQQQRVALARALAPRPDVLLADEPFSNLDASLRSEVRSEVRRLLIGLGITGVFVTHDQDEAFVMGDRVGVLCDGRLAQIDTPDEIYRRPANPFVADFVGTASWLRCSASNGIAHTALGRLPLSAVTASAANGMHARSADEPDEPDEPDDRTGTSTTGASIADAPAVDVMLRPEQLRLASGTSAEVELVEFYGHDSMVVANLDGTLLRVRCGPDPAVRRGDCVAVEFIGADVTAFLR